MARSSSRQFCPFSSLNLALPAVSAVVLPLTQLVIIGTAFTNTSSSTLVRTLEEVIALNEAHAEQEMPYFGQEIFVLAQAKGPLTD